MRRVRRARQLYVSLDEPEPDPVRSLDDRRRLHRMFGVPGSIEGGDNGVYVEDEYAAYDELGPETQRVLTQDCVFKWSAIDIAREMLRRSKHLLCDDSDIAKEVLDTDKRYRGSPSRDDMVMPVPDRRRGIYR